MKKLLFLIILAVLTVPLFSATILINGEKYNFSKIDTKDNDVVFVPLRDFEKLGLGTINQSSDGGIELSTNKMNLMFYKDSDSVRMNSLSLKLPMSTYLDNDKLMVPIAFIMKSLGSDYNQVTDLIITINNLQLPQKNVAKITDTTKQETQTLDKPELENKASAEPVKNEVTETETAKEPASETKEEKVLTKHENPELDSNWFQGTVMAYSKKLNLIDIDLYSADDKLVQTTKSHEGTFAFKNVKNGTYYIKIDHAKNPSFKTFTTDKFKIFNFNGKKISKPLNITRAIKSNGVKTVTINGQTCYNITWSEVPTVANYKVVVSSQNKNAKVAKYDKKVEKINIPISDLSKGQTYGVSIIATDKNGNKIGESVDHGWTFETK